jgi:hypothetical protein
MAPSDSALRAPWRFRPWTGSMYGRSGRGGDPRGLTPVPRGTPVDFPGEIKKLAPCRSKWACGIGMCPGALFVWAA